MRKRDELLALAERCEKASEGSRELDARIACVLDNRSIHVIVDGDVLGRNNQPPHDICIVGWAPSYTTSLDAAMTLVPEGMEIELTDIYSVARAGVGLNAPSGPFYGEHKGGYLALALCAAALRAQAEMES